MNKGDSFSFRFDLIEEAYLAFTDVFKDKNILHTNSEYAKEKGFESKVMHGNILNGYVSYFVGEVLPIRNVMLISQSIKYRKPVYLGNKLLFKASVADFYESVGLFEFKFTIVRGTDVVAKGEIQVKEI
ncbi:MAG: hypothetical protein HEP71_28525 [Roseivirga sp.]|nr:hypothetical protein [Roseivirga sp.]